MVPPIEGVVTFVHHLAPTWRKEMHQTCAELLAASWERSYVSVGPGASAA